MRTAVVLAGEDVAQLGADLLHLPWGNEVQQGRGHRGGRKGQDLRHGGHRGRLPHYPRRLRYLLQRRI